MSLSEPLIMHPKNQFADEIVVRQTNIKNPNDLIINIKVQLDQKKPDIPNDFLICLSMKHMDRVYHWRAASVVNDYTIIQNKEIMWNHYLPSPRSKEDTYHIGLWLNNQTDTVKVKSFEIEMYSR